MDEWLWKLLEYFTKGEDLSKTGAYIIIVIVVIICFIAAHFIDKWTRPKGEDGEDRPYQE